MFGEILRRVREKAPLIHNITNYVTANDCANILIACGASPIMADDPREAGEITSGCDGLNINIGTLNAQTIQAMRMASEKAFALRHPVVLDPVGVGASKLRRETVLELMRLIDFSVIRGNFSEIKTLASGKSRGKGVDIDIEDRMTEKDPDKMMDFAERFAVDNHVITALSGVTDIVTDGKKTYCIYNGHSMMAQITGTGCMLSALITAFISAVPGKKTLATASAVASMGLAGEQAFEKMKASDGSATFRQYLIDSIFNLTPEALEKGAKYEVR